MNQTNKTMNYHMHKSNRIVMIQFLEWYTVTLEWIARSMLVGTQHWIYKV